MPVHLEELSYVELREHIAQGYDTVLLPTGTLEAHGKHLPIGTDAFLAEGIAGRIADAIGAILAPTMHYGITNSLIAYPGGTRVAEDVYAEFVEGIITGLFRAGIKKIVIANGHGGNTSPLQKLVRSMGPKYPDRLVILFDWYELDGDFVEEIYGGKPGHAGQDETAGMIYFRPELVKEDLFDEGDWYLRSDGYMASTCPAPMVLENERSIPEFDTDKARKLFEKILDLLTARIARDLSLWGANFGKGVEG